MIRSLILQLSAKLPRRAKELEILFSTCNDGNQQPPTERMMIALEDIMEGFDEISIFLDALDESVDSQQLLDIITESLSVGPRAASHTTHEQEDPRPRSHACTSDLPRGKDSNTEQFS